MRKADGQKADLFDYQHVVQPIHSEGKSSPAIQGTFYHQPDQTPIAIFAIVA
jgi:hypothetical protein